MKYTFCVLSKDVLQNQYQLLSRSEWFPQNYDYRPLTQLREGNIFTHVSCPRGVCILWGPLWEYYGIRYWNAYLFSIVFGSQILNSNGSVALLLHIIYSYYLTRNRSKARQISSRPWGHYMPYRSLVLAIRHCKYHCLNGRLAKQKLS